MEFFEKTLERQTIFEGKVFTVIKDKVELIDGSQSMREVVLHNGGAGILPVDENGNVTLVKQYRAGAAMPMIEICAGKTEKGEDPESAAIREMKEELGLVAENVTELGVLHATPAYNSEKIYIYMARGLNECECCLDEGEFIQTVKLSLSKAVQMCFDGEITDSKTQIALLKAERILCGKN